MASIDSGEPIEILSDFSYDELSKIEHLIGEVNMVSQTWGSCGAHWPRVTDADKDLINDCYTKAHSIYGDILPTAVEDRLSKELDAITKNGFAIIYSIAQKIVNRAESEGIQVSYRGGVASSLAAFMAGITEYNPLKPHYICPTCRHYELSNASAQYACWVDLPEKICPVCGERMSRRGYDLPYETFLGVMFDREPDIDILVDSSYQRQVINYLRDWFGKDNIFKARMDEDASNSEECVNGIFILPNDEDVFDFTPIDRPYDFRVSDIPITHFHYTELDRHLFKQDIIGSKALHLLKMLHDRTGVSPQDIPLDDDKTIRLFSTPGEYGYQDNIEDIDIGIYGIPFVDDDRTIEILSAVKPMSLSELIKVIGLSSGANTWQDNAEKLITEHNLSIEDLISCREDIVSYLTDHDIDYKDAYRIMNMVRMGRELKNDQLALMNEHDIPQWYIDSCSRISFLWPRSWALSKAVTAYRLAWYKLYYPTVFYSVWLACYAPEYDGDFFRKDSAEIKECIKRLEEAKEECGQLLQIEDDILRIYKVLYDIRKRGYAFEDDVCSLGEEIADRDIPSPIDDERYELIAEWIQDVLGYFGEKDQVVLKYRFENQNPYARSVSETSRKFGISESRVRYLEARAARLVKQPRFREKHSEPWLPWDYSNGVPESISDEEYEELVSFEYDLLPGVYNYDPINAEDTLDLTELLKCYEESNTFQNADDEEEEKCTEQ